MELNDFSSVFELLCGYNLVNAINSNSEILKVLDFTSPTKEGIADFKDRLKQKSNDLISGFRKNQDETNTESHESIDLKLQSVYAVRTSTDSLETKNNRHEKKASNLYLVAGIFCFLILIQFPFVESYHKLNTVAILLFHTFLLFIVFLKCDYPPKNRMYKTILIICLIIAGLFVTGAGIFHYSIFERNDNLFLLALLPIILLAIFIFLRKKVIKRKIFKSLFILTFLSPLFIPNIGFQYEIFYNKENACNNQSQGMLLVLTIIIALIPLVYDILTTNWIARKLNRLEKSLDPVYQKSVLAKEIVKEGLNKSQKDTDPVSGL